MKGEKDFFFICTFSVFVIEAELRSAVFRLKSRIIAGGILFLLGFSSPILTTMNP